MIKGHLRSGFAGNKGLHTGISTHYPGQLRGRDASFQRRVPGPGARRIPREGSPGLARGRGLGTGGVSQPAGVSAPGARPAGAREGLPPRGGGAGARSPLTASAREFQFETYGREGAGVAAGGWR